MIDKILNYVRNEFSSRTYSALRDFEQAGNLGFKEIMDRDYPKETKLLLDNGYIMHFKSTVPGFSLRDLLDGKPVKKKPPVTIDHYVWTPKGERRLRLLERLSILLQ